MLPLNDFVHEPIDGNLFRSAIELAHQLGDLAYGCIHKSFSTNEVHIQYRHFRPCHRFWDEDRNTGVRGCERTCIAGALDVRQQLTRKRDRTREWKFMNVLRIGPGHNCRDATTQILRLTPNDDLIACILSWRDSDHAFTGC